MKKLWIIRLIPVILFFVESVLFLTDKWPDNSSLCVAERVQIIPSAITISLTATIFWIILTFLFGRIYCSTVCPVGTFLDLPRWVRNLFSRRKKKFRYQPRNRTRRDVLIIYLVTLLLGFLPVAYLIEPWNMTRNMVSTVSRSAILPTWGSMAMGMSIGLCVGVITLVGLLVWGWMRGRQFCSQFCPIGTALGSVHQYSVYHIEIDPDMCTNCMKCQEACPSECIKVVSRYVDNSRCVKCFECLKECDNNAIRYQPNRNRPASPLMKRRRVSE